MKTRLLIVLVTITIGVIVASTVGTMEYQSTYNQNCNSDGGKIVGFLRCIYINEDFDVPKPDVIEERFHGLIKSQIIDIQQAELGCKKIGNQTYCDIMVQEKIDYYLQQNQGEKENEN